MMGVTPSEEALLQKHVEATFNGAYVEWPGGYPNKIELCLIDAVLSIRARYGSATSGVRRRVKLWSSREEAGDLDDLTRIAGMDPAELANVIDNQQQLNGGLTKAEAMVGAASRLVDAGAQTSSMIDPGTPPTNGPTRA